MISALITAQYGFFSMIEDKGYLKDGVTIKRQNEIVRALTAEVKLKNKVLDWMLLKNNVYYENSLQKMQLTCDQALFRRVDNYIRAAGKVELHILTPNQKKRFVANTLEIKDNKIIVLTGNRPKAYIFDAA